VCIVNISNKLYCFDAGRRLHLMLQLLLLLCTQQHCRSLHRNYGFPLVVRCRMRQWLLRLFNVETALLTLVCCLLLLLLDELELLLLGRVDVDCGKSIY
jgi:hypothetical protein